MIKRATGRVDTRSRWEGTAPIIGFQHEVSIDYEQDVKVHIRVENEFYKIYELDAPWSQLTPLVDDLSDLEPGARSRLSRHLLDCLKFVASKHDQRKKLLVLEKPLKRPPSMRRKASARKIKFGRYKETAVRPKEEDMPLIMEEPPEMEEMKHFPIDLGEVDINYAPHKLKAKVFKDGTIEFLGMDELEKFVRIKATKEQADDLIASKRSLLLHPDKIESRLKVLASMLTYMAAGGDNRRKHLGFRKQSAPNIKMRKRKEKRLVRTASGRGDRVILSREEAELLRSQSKRRIHKASPMATPTNSRVASGRARRRWDHARLNMDVVLHSNPALSKMLDGYHKYNRSLFKGAAMLLTQAVELGAAKWCARPATLLRRCGRANLETYRATGQREYLQRAHDAYKEALSHLANLSSVDVWMETGLVYLRHGSWDGAAAVFARIINDFPRYQDMNEVIFQAALVMLHLKMYDQAVAYFSAILANVPKPMGEEHILFLLGHCYTLMGEPARAEASFEDVLRRLQRRKPAELRPRYAPPHDSRRSSVQVNVASAAAALAGSTAAKRPARAIEISARRLRKIQALDEGWQRTAALSVEVQPWLATVAAWSSLAQFFAARGDQVLAHVWYREALGRASDGDRTDSLLVGAAKSALAVGENAQARKLAEEAAALNPAAPAPQYVLKLVAPDTYGEVVVKPEADPKLQGITELRQQREHEYAKARASAEADATLVIQSAARGMKSRLRVRKMRQAKAIIVLQAAGRGMLGRTKARAVRERHEAVVKIQSVARAKAARHRVDVIRQTAELTPEERAQHEAEVAAKRAAEIAEQKRRELEAERKLNAGAIITRVGRGHLGRQRASRKRLELMEAEEAAAAASEREQQAQRDAAAALQRKARQDLLRKLEAEKRAREEEMAAIAAKENKAREAAHAKAAERRARLDAKRAEAAALQDRELVRHESATRIQALLRGHADRRRVERMRRSRDARRAVDAAREAEEAALRAEQDARHASKLQELQKRRQAQEDARKAREHARLQAERAERARVAAEAETAKHEAAQRAIDAAQAAAKAAMQEARAAQLAHRDMIHKAATTIQSAGRMWLARRRVQALRQRMREAEARRAAEEAERARAKNQQQRRAMKDSERAAALAAEMAYNPHAHLTASADGLTGLDIFSLAAGGGAGDGVGDGAGPEVVDPLAVAEPEVAAGLPARRPLFRPPSLGTVVGPGRARSPGEYGTGRHLGGGAASASATRGRNTRSPNTANFGASLGAVRPTGRAKSPASPTAGAATATATATSTLRPSLNSTGSRVGFAPVTSPVTGVAGGGSPAMTDKLSGGKGRSKKASRRHNKSPGRSNSRRQMLNRTNSPLRLPAPRQGPVPDTAMHQPRALSPSIVGATGPLPSIGSGSGREYGDSNYGEPEMAPRSLAESQPAPVQRARSTNNVLRDGHGVATGAGGGAGSGAGVGAGASEAARRAIHSSEGGYRSPGSARLGSPQAGTRLSQLTRPLSTNSLLSSPGTHRGGVTSPGSDGTDSRPGTPQRYTAMMSVRHMAFLGSTSPAGGDTGQVRFDTLQHARRAGAIGSVTQPYVRHWRRVLERSLAKYDNDLRAMRRRIAEVRTTHPGLSNEEAFCALADCDGDVRIAKARLVDGRFVDQVSSICRVVDVNSFIVGSIKRQKQHLSASTSPAVPQTHSSPPQDGGPASGGAGGGSKWAHALGSPEKKSATNVSPLRGSKSAVALATQPHANMARTGKAVTPKPRRKRGAGRKTANLSKAHSCDKPGCIECMVSKMRNPIAPATPREDDFVFAV